MRYLFISLCCFSLLSCATIPDQAYHKVVCATEDSCAKTELDANIKPVTNMVIVNGVSVFREDQVEKKQGDSIANTSFNLLYLEYAENGQKVIEKYLQSRDGNYNMMILNDDLTLMNSN